MLAQVIKSREASRAVALKGPFAGVLSNVAGQVFASSETKIAWREVGTKKALSLLLF
jgi:hypothetical protein